MNTMHCDVAVIGAGPAGAMAAHGLARHGADVVLIDKAAFPRFKVCGCCLNAAALQTLERAGIAPAVAALGGRPLARLQLAAAGQRAESDLPGGVALSRRALDATLVDEAQRAGARLLQRTGARWAGASTTGHRLQLRTPRGADGPDAGGPGPAGTDTGELEAGVVLGADGLGGSFLRSVPGFPARVRPASYMGVGTVVAADARPPADPAPGTVQMACARFGYCGLVRLEDDRVAVAAAADGRFIRRCGGPGAAAARLIAEADLPPVTGLRDAPWHGTPGLTRRRPVAGRRLLLLGDAAGYVEPFTGEGMAWALASGEAVVPFALRAAEDGPAAWRRAHRRLLRHHHRRCRQVARALRHPRLVRGTLRALDRWPGLAAGLVGRIGAGHGR